MAEGTKITKNCGCTADKNGNTQAALFQDKTYGKGIRLFTGSGKVGVGKERCTVCGTAK